MGAHGVRHGTGTRPDGGSIRRGGVQVMCAKQGSGGGGEGGAEGSGSGGGLEVGACFVGRGGACVVLVIREIPDTCLSITWFR